MRLLVVAMCGALLAVSALGQYRGGGRGAGGRGVSSGHARAGGSGFRGPAYRAPSYGGGFYRSPSYGGRGVFSYGHFGHSRSYYPRYRSFGANYPVFVGGFSYGYYDSYPYYSQPYYSYPYYAPGVTVIAPPPPPPQVYYAYSRPAPPPLVREYREPSSSREEAVYLIAFRDETIQAAVAYWTEGDTLHYVTRLREQKRVALATVDIVLSERLNRERGVSFRLSRP
ncbi:MAG: hypothetical protein ACRD8O_07270 [Bryobacteraceae bacterium]